jgi:Bacterial Ig-like domain (group 3)
VLAPGLRPARGRLAVLAAVVALSLALGLTRGAQPALSDVPCSGSFTSVGETVCTVPFGIPSITTTVTGGAGAPGVWPFSSIGPVPGGNGDVIRATFAVGSDQAVAPGQALFVEVGVGGGVGTAGGSFAPEPVAGGNGGGESDVRLCSAASCSNGIVNALVVAGGGGGGGAWDGSATPPNSYGGNAGSPGLVGPAFSFTSGAGGGGAGTASSGGAGGSAALCQGNPIASTPGGVGGQGTGGNGGVGAAGGGGAGFFGGGGGGGINTGAWRQSGNPFCVGAAQGLLGGGGGGGGGGTDFISVAAKGTSVSSGTGATPSVTFASTPTPVSVNLGSAQNPSLQGQSVTFTATVTCAGFTPTGTVTFTIDGTPVSPVTLSGGTATFMTSSLAVGSHTVTAAYSGAGNCGGTTSAPLTQTVNQTGMTLTSSPNPSPPGQPVTFTATLTCPIALASGAVTFLDNGSPIATPPINSKATPPIAAVTISTLPPGSHNVTATYSGGGGCAGTTSNRITQVVGAAGYGIVLTSSQNPSTPGQPVTFTTTPSCPGFAPTGIVTFTIDGVVGSPVKLIGGVASLTTSSLATGSHSVSAFYSGDGNCGPATSAVLTQMVGTAVSVAQPGDSEAASKTCQSLPAAEQQACFVQAIGNLGTSNPTPLPAPLPGSYCTMPDKSREWVPQGGTPTGCVG